MKHLVRAFCTTTERLAFRVEIPDENVELLTVLMGWQEPDDPIYEYELSDEQVSSLEALTGKRFNRPGYLFFLSCSA